MTKCRGRWRQVSRRGFLRLWGSIWLAVRLWGVDFFFWDFFEGDIQGIFFWDLPAGTVQILPHYGIFLERLVRLLCQVRNKILLNTKAADL